MRLLARLSMCLLVIGVLLPPARAADISAGSWSETDSSNTSAPPNGWPSGVFPNQVEPISRATMGAIKRFYNHINATATSGGSANAQTLAYSVAPTAYVAGDTYRFKVGGGLTNTGAATLNINSLGATTVQLNGNALTGGELVAGAYVSVVYDGTNFQLISQPASNYQLTDGAISTALTPLATFGNSTSITAHTIRQNITGDIQRDVAQSVVVVPSGSTVANADGFGAYVLNQNPSGPPTFGNGVGYFGISAIDDINNSAVWFANGIITDSLNSGAPHTNTGDQLIGIELDFGVTSPATVVSGFNVQLQGSQSQPTAADAFALSPNVAGSIHWIHGFVCNDAATTSSGDCLVIGAQAKSGTNVLSQNTVYGYFDGAGVERTYLSGVNAGGQFYFQNSAGSGTAVVNSDGGFAMGNSGSITFGGETAISTSLHAVDIAPTNSITTLTLGNGSGLTTMTVGNSSSTLTLSVGNGGTATKYVCVDSSNKVVIQSGAC